MSSLGYVQHCVRDSLWFASFVEEASFFTFAVLILALGIGANTAIFSVVDEVLLRPLQFRDSNQLVMVWEDFSHAGFPENPPSPSNFLDWMKRNHVFTDWPRCGTRTFIGASLVLLAVGAVASYYPARRAASIDPMEALRCE